MQTEKTKLLDPSADLLFLVDIAEEEAEDFLQRQRVVLLRLREIGADW